MSLVKHVNLDVLLKRTREKKRVCVCVDESIKIKAKNKYKKIFSKWCIYSTVFTRFFLVFSSNLSIWVSCTSNIIAGGSSFAGYTLHMYYYYDYYYFCLKCIRPILLMLNWLMISNNRFFLLLHYIFNRFNRNNVRSFDFCLLRLGPPYSQSFPMYFFFYYTIHFTQFTLNVFKL